MVFKIIQAGNTGPLSYPVNPISSFEGGMIAQLDLYGNNVVCGVSDGTAPLGIIDDVKTTAFYEPAIDDTPIVPVVGIIAPDGKMRSVADAMATLHNSNIMKNSFVANIPIYLKETNGVIIVPAGTELNYDKDGDGTVDAVRVICSYVFQKPGIPGNDSTAGSKRVTIWFGRMIFETNQFETSQHYPLNAPLFVSEAGILTTRQPSKFHFAVGFVVGPPTARNSTLQAMWW